MLRQLSYSFVYTRVVGRWGSMSKKKTCVGAPPLHLQNAERADVQKSIFFFCFPTLWQCPSQLGKAKKGKELGWQGRLMRKSESDLYGHTHCGSMVCWEHLIIGNRLKHLWWRCCLFEEDERIHNHHRPCLWAFFPWLPFCDLLFSTFLTGRHRRSDLRRLGKPPLFGSHIHVHTYKKNPLSSHRTHGSRMSITQSLSLCLSLLSLSPLTSLMLLCLLGHGQRAKDQGQGQSSMHATSQRKRTGMSSSNKKKGSHTPLFFSLAPFFET